MDRKWWKEAVIYQIYPRSFADSNGDGIGDLNGITAHLDYLKALGVDVLWLSPIYQSPMADNGYDISDYRAIQPEFGTMEDFDRLLAEAHKRGLRIIMDLVVNHTSIEHAWFRESRKSKDNPYRDHYIWRDGRPGGLPPNNWGAVFGGSAWQYDEATGQYYLHLFAPQQPDLNWASPQVREAVYDMMRWWCDKGIDGFRMDTASFIAKSGYADGPVAPNAVYGDFGPYSLNQPMAHVYLKEMREKVLSHYDVMIVGECGGATAADALQYANLDGSELDMVFTFEHVDAGERRIGKWTDVRLPMPELRAILNRWQLQLQGRAWNSLYMDNHDQPRMVSRFGNDSPLWRTRSAKMLATCLHGMQGTPYVYQGEELGMTNAYFERREDYRDIETLNCWDEYVRPGLVDEDDMLRYLKHISRDNARTPMQWANAPQAGFTSGTPWIPVCRNYAEINAADQMQDGDSVFRYYQKLIALRRQYPILVYGSFAPLCEDDEAVYAYKRELDGQTLYVLCNFTDQVVPCTVLDGVEGETLLCNYKGRKAGALQPYEARMVLA